MAGSEKVVVSIIVCTRHHDDALRETLASFRDTDTPADLPTEVLIVDNGPLESTERLVTQTPLPHFRAVRYLPEPRPGQCYARNTGLAAAQGNIILFTDDDVRLPAGWIQDMCSPIQSGEADAVAGGVRLAPHLQRPWMTPQHRTWLASTECLDPEEPLLVGANMAFGRHVLSKVPEFDTELGPGRLGFGDDTLFAGQLREAGFRIVKRPDITVEHHFDEDRLLRASYLAAAQKHGRSLAYITHHWHHSSLALPALRGLRTKLQIALRRLKDREAVNRTEGMPTWEMEAVQFLSFCQNMQKEVKRPRHYEYHGFVKLTDE